MEALELLKSLPELIQRIMELLQGPMEDSGAGAVPAEGAASSGGVPAVPIRKGRRDATAASPAVATLSARAELDAIIARNVVGERRATTVLHRCRRRGMSPQPNRR